MILDSNNVLALNVTQNDYDSVSLNRKSTFINLFDSDEEYLTSVNTLDLKAGQDFLFLAEVLRAAELEGKAALNSLVSYKGLVFRLAAVQTTALQTNLKQNVAKREDFQKKSQVPAAPAQQQYQNQPIQQQQNVF